jgi:hypothetical protein
VRGGTARGDAPAWRRIMRGTALRSCMLCSYMCGVCAAMPRHSAPPVHAAARAAAARRRGGARAGARGGGGGPGRQRAGGQAGHHAGADASSALVQQRQTCERSL